MFFQTHAHTWEMFAQVIHCSIICLRWKRKTQKFSTNGGPIKYFIVQYTSIWETMESSVKMEKVSYTQIQEDLQDILSLRKRGAFFLVMYQCHFLSCEKCTMVMETQMMREAGWGIYGNPALCKSELHHNEKLKKKRLKEVCIVWCGHMCAFFNVYV